MHSQPSASTDSINPRFKIVKIIIIIIIHQKENKYSKITSKNAPKSVTVEYPCTREKLNIVIELKSKKDKLEKKIPRIIW